ncbi:MULTISPECIES: hypothetical protein [Sphingobacterium]|uniref:SPW repeat domain-containing protein n=1 Tax=Sphingobacterium TaxID=28453 RepID=UPI000428BB66|nr:hypothetical protein [Sphingobacterium sp. IITKGP-BTPF85]
MRNLISTQWHAFLDYILAFTLLVGPWIFGYSEDHYGKLISVLAGGLIIVLSVLTRYEGGLIRIIPMPLHLNMDVVLGVFLIVSPFVLDLVYEAIMCLVILGILILGSGLYSIPEVKKHEPPVDIKYDTERD